MPAPPPPWSAPSARPTRAGADRRDRDGPASGPAERGFPPSALAPAVTMIGDLQEFALSATTKPFIVERSITGRLSRIRQARSLRLRLVLPM